MSKQGPSSLRAIALAILLLATGLGADTPGCGEGEPPPVDPGFAARQLDYLEYAVAGGGGLHAQMARLVLGEPIDEAPIREAIDDVVAQPDTSDFSAIALTRLLYLSDTHPGLDAALIDDIEQAMLGFRFWLDEPGDGKVSLTENHQITYHAAELLMGQRFPDTVFPGSQITGAKHVAKVRPRILRWLEDRARFGYSEWLSETYYGIDITPLVSLVDFANDGEIRTRAAIALDLLVYDLALNSHEGFLGSTRGRVPNTPKKFDMLQGTVATPMAILFGKGGYRGRGESAGTAIATGTYGPPRVIAEIARDTSSFVTRQRNGILVEEGPRYGYGYETVEDGVFWYGMGAWSHPLVAPLAIELALEEGIFPGARVPAVEEAVNAAAELPGGLITLIAWLIRPIAAGSVYDQANIITWRSADGTLSSVQDKMKGQAGFQQHAWQATLGQKAVVFTTHPGPLKGESPIGGTEWLGGSSMPRVGQHENVAIVLYDAAVETLYGGVLADLFPDYTHAYFPRADFDEVTSQGGWTFGRKGTGYVALYSDAPTTWVTEGEFADRELTAPGSRNAWICELGSASTHGSFASFVSAIASAPVSVNGSDVSYTSPSQGAMSFGWNAPLVVGGAAQDLGPHPRYDNPFSRVPWGARQAVIQRGESSLVLGLTAGTRSGS